MKTSFNETETALDVFLKFFTMLLALGYIFGGVYMIKLGSEGIAISKTHTVALSIILMGYGTYRVIRIFQHLIEERHVK